MKISIILSLALLASSAIASDVIARDPFEAGAVAPWSEAKSSATEGEEYTGTTSKAAGYTETTSKNAGYTGTTQATNTALGSSCPGWIC